MRLSSSYSKSIFISSLACFSLMPYSDVLGGCASWETYNCCGCSGNAANCTSSTGCESSSAEFDTDHPTIAFNNGAWCFGGTDSDVKSCCTTGFTCMNFIANAEACLTFELNENMPAAGNIYYLAWNAADSDDYVGGITFLARVSGYSPLEMGLQYNGYTNGYAQQVVFGVNTTYVSSATIYLSNTNNNFVPGSAIQPNEYTTVQVDIGGAGVSTITGITGINFNNGGLAIPNGGTFDIGMVNLSDASGYFSGGSSTSPLNFTSTWSGLSSSAFAYLYDYINLSSTAVISGSGGYVILNDGCVLGLNGIASTPDSSGFYGCTNFGSGTVLYMESGSYVQFQVGGVTIVNDMFVTPGDNYMDVNGFSVGIGAAISNSGSTEANLVFYNSSATDGVMSIYDGSQIGSNIFLEINPNVSVFTNLTSGATPYIILTGGTLSL